MDCSSSQAQIVEVQIILYVHTLRSVLMNTLMTLNFLILSMMMNCHQLDLIPGNVTLTMEEIATRARIKIRSRSHHGIVHIHHCEPCCIRWFVERPVRLRRS